MTLRILHTGDLQLGYTQYGYAARKSDFNRAAKSAISLGPELGVDCVVIAGDLFEVPEPPASAVLALKHAVDDCTAAGIPVLGVYGNHDAGDEDPEENGGWLSVCGIQNLENDTAVINRRVVGGLNFRHNELFERDLELYLSRRAGLHVLVLHQALAEFTGFPVPLTAKRVAELIKASASADTCKLVLMGDIHIHEVQEIDGITFTYCGATEWNGAGESPVKRVSEITLTEDLRTQVNGHLLDTRTVVRHKVTQVEHMDDLRAAVAADPEHDTLYDVVYDPELPDIRKEIRTVLKGRMYRMAFIPKKNSGLTTELLVHKGETEQVRGATAAALRQTLDAAYPTGDPRRELILRLLDSPATVEEIITQYIKEKTNDHPVHEDVQDEDRRTNATADS